MDQNARIKLENTAQQKGLMRYEGAGSERSDNSNQINSYSKKAESRRDNSRPVEAFKNVRYHIRAAAQVLDWNNIRAAVVFCLAIISFIAVYFDTGFKPVAQGWGFFLVSLALAAPAAVLGFSSFFGLIAYFAFIPSVSKASTIFSKAHAARMVHPFLSALTLGLISLYFYTASQVAFWGVVITGALYSIQTLFLAANALQEPESGEYKGLRGIVFLILSLIVGGELITYASGARPIPAWKLESLPSDVWIVDVRTKPEFHWNRFNAAENYPWGKGLKEAAANKPKDRPVLVTCFSGHRSPSSAAMLKRMGFNNVYNLNWGIIYSIMTQGPQDQTSPFGLTRAGRDPHRRGEDLTAITRGHVTLILLMLIFAPLLNSYLSIEVSSKSLIAGTILGILGLAIGVASKISLGRNFRVYAAPRRSGSLVTTGVYSKVRHPMYTGVVIGLAGYILAWGAYQLWPLWIACAALYAIKGIKEDKILEAKFPEYKRYKNDTTRFVPYLF